MKKLYLTLAMSAFVFGFVESQTISNVALNATNWQVSSSYNSSYGGDKAIDGVVSVSSKWTSQGVSGNHWLKLDLGETYNITSFTVKHAGSAGEPTYLNTSKYYVYTSYSWSGPWYYRAYVDNSSQQNITTSNVSVSDRYVLLYVTDPGIDNYARIPEFEVYAETNCSGVVLTNSGDSSLEWPFANSYFISETCGTYGLGCGSDGWLVTCGPGCGLHVDDDYYADDWVKSYGDNTCDEDFLSPMAGTVIYAANYGSGYGNQVIVQSSENTNFAFRVAHLNTISVTDGQTVYAGTKLGEIGATGGDFVCHPHCVLYKNIYSRIAPGYLTGIQYLENGHPPSSNITSGAPATIFAAPYYFNATCGSSSAMRTASTESQVETVIKTEEELFGANRISIYPNPLKETGTLILETTENKNVTIIIQDMLGKLVKEIAVDLELNSGKNEVLLNVSDFKPGLYNCIINSDNNQESIKLQVIN